MATAELQAPRSSATETGRDMTSGFLQTGGVKLTERSTLPGSSWFTRLLLRNTPVPVLVHSLLDELSANRSLQFVEDRYMPEPFLRYLNNTGLQLGPPESFFLHDRQSVRGGLILAGRAPGESPANLRDFAEDLRRRLTHWLRMADRSPDEASLVTVDDAHDFFSRRFVHYNPVGVLLWAAERSPIERWFGARSTHKGLLHIPAPGATSAADLQTPMLPGVQSPDGGDSYTTIPPGAGDVFSGSSSSESGVVDAGFQSESRPFSSAVDRPALLPGESLPAVQSPESPGSTELSVRSPESSADPTETVHEAGCFQYQVVGRTRGPVSGGRKYHIRRDGHHLRIALLASETGRLQPDHALAFFDRLQFAGDLIRTHRDLLRAMPVRPAQSPAPAAGTQLPRRNGQNQSLSLELNCESGVFRCVAYGITPLFFRRKSGRLYPLPDSAEVSGGDSGETLKTVEGVFYPGDALLLMPGVYTVSERRELVARYRSLLSESDQGPQDLAGDLARSLGPWLDARLRGRGLFIGRP